MIRKKISSQQIDELLPQTQCGECGYPGCMPYAEAMAAGLAPLNLCPPGGVQTIQNLGELLGKDVTEYLSITPAAPKPSVAKIREDECIGCTKCISACPVDAIIGASKHMHSVIEFECTGCKLCIEPCPVDCIDIVDTDLVFDKNKARARHNAKKIRELKHRQAQNERYLEKRSLARNTEDKQADIKAKQDYIMQAMRRAQQKKQAKDE